MVAAASLLRVPGRPRAQRSPSHSNQGQTR